MLAMHTSVEGCVHQVVEVREHRAHMLMIIIRVDIGPKALCRKRIDHLETRETFPDKMVTRLGARQDKETLASKDDMHIIMLMRILMRIYAIVLPRRATSEHCSNV